MSETTPEVHETPLGGILRDELARAGRMTFRDFMERALYDPRHGYYARGAARVGRSGDFFTNVSVGPLFGTLLARQFNEIWERLGRPQPFTIVEQGAHDGRFAHDMLNALRKLAPECSAAAEYFIVEPFPELRERQRLTLAAEDRVRWTDSLDALPSFTGVHFSNELLDAFPTHLIHYDATGWRERWVEWQNGQFTFTDGPLSSDSLVAAVAEIGPRSPGYSTEMNLAARQWPGDVARKMERGFVLPIDYGHARSEFYAPERSTGTLRAYSRHRVVPDPLARPGTVDLTAHVEFTSLVEAAETAGLRLHGFTDQHHFFVGLGRLHFPDGIVPDAAEMREFKTLMHPSLLGLSFKVLALEKGLPPGPPLSGFGLSGDARRQLA